MLADVFEPSFRLHMEWGWIKNKIFKNHSDAHFVCSWNAKSVISHCCWCCWNSLQGGLPGLENDSGPALRWEKRGRQCCWPAPCCDARLKPALGWWQWGRIFVQMTQITRKTRVLFFIARGDPTILSGGELGSVWAMKRFNLPSSTYEHRSKPGPGDALCYAHVAS